MTLWMPAGARAAGLCDDDALIGAMLRVEAGWITTLGAAGVATDQQVAAVLAATRTSVAAAELEPGTENAGNPVVPLVQLLRSRIADPAAAALLHRGLTSQDVLDTALMLIVTDTLGRVDADLGVIAGALAALASRYRNAPMVGRTLTQYAVPITFGLVAAQWLTGVLDARVAVRRCRRSLPVQCGGAAGTLALASELTDPLPLVTRLAATLGLVDPGLPWHTRRQPITRTGAVLVETTDVLGVIAANVTLLGRPEIAEVTEGTATGRGGSSTMPHKRNPVLSVLIRSIALQNPACAGLLHTAAGQAVDQRPDGAWHAEWPTLQAMLARTATATSLAAELIPGLHIDQDVMRARAETAAAELLAERDGTSPTAADSATHRAAVDSYLGAAGRLVDRVLKRHRAGCG